MPDLGLNHSAISTIAAALAAEPTVERAVVYGSRAKGNFRPGSDIDIVLFGDGLDLAVLGRISGALDDSPLPWKVDLAVWQMIDNQDLREHIGRVGVLLYERARP